MFRRAAGEVVKTYHGRVPRDPGALSKLPGVGRYTAGAVCAFAFNMPVVLLETNIRSVYIHFFFPRKKRVSDAEIVPLIEQTLDSKNPREWYWALMDYGSHLKKLHKNPSQKSSSYRRQSPLKGSVREARGKILKVLLNDGAQSAKKLAERTGIEPARVSIGLRQLEKEGFIKKQKNFYVLA
jgi:A/G-specific adenine glycosylase